MKALKPSMREKKRYLLVEGINLKKDIPAAIKNFVGSSGLSEVGLGWIKSDEISAIISINRESIGKVRASLVIWPNKIEVLKVSGTLKGLKKA